MTAPPQAPVPSAFDALPPPPRRHRSAHRRGRSLLHLILCVLGVVVLAVAVVGTWSVVGAYAQPGNESFSAKWADWMRSHRMGPLISSVESYYYTSHEPKKGGAPKGLNPVLQARAAAPAPSAGDTIAPGAPLPAPAPVHLVVSPHLPEEGQWLPVGPKVGGGAAMYEAQFRADTTFTSEITTAVWIDPFRLHVSLIPGLTEPGGRWSHPPYITPAEAPRILAAFNGGFRFQDAHGGFYLDGRTAVPLRAGAASFVIYRSGRVDIGAWGTEVSMTPNVVAVLQNLVPMVDHGVVSPSASHHDTAVWGNTLNTKVVVARSGVGVTAQGALVYVAGPALTAKTLAEALQRAGAARAMTLDINPEWVTFNIYSHPDPRAPTYIRGSKLYPQMQRPADRYIGPTEESRDFFEVSLQG